MQNGYEVAWAKAGLTSPSPPKASAAMKILRMFEHSMILPVDAEVKGNCKNTSGHNGPGSSPMISVFPAPAALELIYRAPIGVNAPEKIPIAVR